MQILKAAAQSPAGYSAVEEETGIGITLIIKLGVQTAPTQLLSGLL